MGIQSPGLHISDRNDPAILVDERDAQRDEGILHPEAVIALCLKDEEHPLVFVQMFSFHQSVVSLFWGLGDLHPDFFLLDIKGNFQETLRIGEGA